MEFKKVKTQTRTYVYPPSKEREEYKLTIKDVISVNISGSGTHRLNTMNNMKHIVVPGWVHIEFDADEWSF